MHSFGKKADLTNVKSGGSNSNHSTSMAEKKTELKADPLPHKLHGNIQKCKRERFQNEQIPKENITSF